MQDRYIPYRAVQDVNDEWTSACDVRQIWWVPAVSRASSRICTQAIVMGVAIRPSCAHEWCLSVISGEVG